MHVHTHSDFLKILVNQDTSEKINTLGRIKK